MWFKNLIVYRFTKPFTLAAEQLAEQLAALPFRPCGSQEVSRVGFVPPTGEDGDYVHQASGYIMICIKKQQRVLPAAAINEAVEEKISLSDRFGLWLSFYPISQDEYLNIVDHLFPAVQERSALHRAALKFAYTKGVRSGRAAKQFYRAYSGEFN